MSNMNIESVIKNLDLKKIDEERKNGKSVEEILKGIDLKPIIREEMAKVNPDVEEKEIDEVVSQINLTKVAEEINKVKIHMEEFTGKSFEDLSEEDMRMLQGAGDIEGEFTPATITTSSYPCIGAVSAVASGVLSFAKC